MQKWDILQYFQTAIQIIYCCDIIIGIPVAEMLQRRAISINWEARV